MSFVVSGLSVEPFRALYGLSEEQLRERGARRYVVDAKPGFPDRIELRDLDVGETALLVNYMHHDADTPYRASHAVFVREGAETTGVAVDVIPEPLRVRLLSLRAFDEAGMMVGGEVVDGAAAAAEVERLLADPAVAYIHAHYAKRGCYAARIVRS